MLATRGLDALKKREQARLGFIPDCLVELRQGGRLEENLAQHPGEGRPRNEATSRHDLDPGVVGERAWRKVGPRRQHPTARNARGGGKTPNHLMAFLRDDREEICKHVARKAHLLQNPPGKALGDPSQGTRGA